MGLEQYRRQRLIVLHPKSTAYEAARAMVENHVGAVLVADDRALVGIVTDRDLACEVVAAELEPTMTPLRDILSDEIFTVDIGADTAAVVALMRDHAVRRVPVMEGGAAVGLVTLDDLLLDGAIGAQEAVDILRAQLETPARHKRAGAVHPEAPAHPRVAPRGARALLRRSARAASSYARLIKLVEDRTRIEDRAHAELALKVVLGSICRRVTPPEARHLIAQLPSVIKDELSTHLDGPDRRITLAGMEKELSNVLSVGPDRAADIAQGVALALADSISEGQIEELKGQLPKEMKELFPSWAVKLRDAE